MEGQQYFLCSVLRKSMCLGPAALRLCFRLALILSEIQVLIHPVAARHRARLLVRQLDSSVCFYTIYMIYIYIIFIHVSQLFFKVFAVSTTHNGCLF